MKIAICDDEPIFLKRMYGYLWQQPDCVVECFLSPDTLLHNYKSGERYDVVFLDIVMPPVNGIDLAKAIREYDEYVILVFFTAYLEYAPAGYEVNAFRYLLKPVTEDDMLRTIKDIRVKLENASLLVRTPECDLLLHIQDLQHLEADNKNTILFYKGDMITLRKGLNELETLLPASFFFRIHRKYIINLAYVREFDEAHVTLDSGRTFPVSRRNIKEFRHAIKAYIEGAPRV
ncbi:MAG: LytTR family DNA-binding domain-containing protein [Lachnospiraceae bacterium]|nr:LytTR family DNA-binding domain-containing protein [Lachnospiraceae bacterium]